MSAMPLIEVEGISKTFRSGMLRRAKHALQGLDLSVHQGEIFGFLGPNGAGKTTSIKILLGLIRASSGRGTVLGQPFGSLEARAGLGYLPDLPYFYSYLSGRELLRFSGKLHDLHGQELERRIEATLERVHLLPEAWDRRLGTYSRGMLQRVGTAAAILHRPRLLILDEPMTGLDPIGRRQFRDLLNELREEGVTVFFSTHHLADIEQSADRVGLLAEGRLIQCGSLENILTGGKRTVEVSVEIPSGSFLSDFTDSTEGWRTFGHEHRWHAPDLESANAITRRILDAGGRLIAFTPHRESLEDFFVREVTSTIRVAGRKKRAHEGTGPSYRQERTREEVHS
jgi:ABC-2 type transport system ATP-binding protein